MRLTNIRIATLIRMGFAMMGVLVLLLGVLGWTQLNRVNEQYKLTFEDRYPKVKIFFSIKTQADAIARAMRNVLLVNAPAQLSAELKTVEKASLANAAALDELSRIMTTTAGVAGVTKMRAAHSAYTDEAARIIQLVQAGEREAAVAALLDSLQARQIDYMAATDELVVLGDQLMQLSGDDITATVDQARTLILTLLVAALGLAALISHQVVRSIVPSLNDAVAVASSVAAGDLSIRIRDGGDNETGRLLRAMQHMQARLSALVGEVRQGAEGVATASAQISSGNHDLSGRTEEQASALEETAASMEELGSTVRGNADNAQQANQLALAASSVATRGGEAVGQVVQTMREISDSSRKIADIIGVIDGIAFQTNILALNAAVEAARAGEQGRGFAVVAAEVRTLAGRSAEAAKEIKSLINASVERVELGSSQVDSAGATITEVVASIRRVTDIVGEISAASREQSTGVAQVGEAVTQMDRATQENAALVEQSAAAAESLKAQAQQLVQSVAVFRLA
jgi:methyl-accepting chemotaxis protein